MVRKTDMTWNPSKWSVIESFPMIQPTQIVTGITNKTIPIVHLIVDCIVQSISCRRACRTAIMLSTVVVAKGRMTSSMNVLEILPSWVMACIL